MRKTGRPMWESMIVDMCMLSYLCNCFLYRHTAAASTML